MVATHSDIDAHIEANAGRFLDDLKHFCSFPSISNHGEEALTDCRGWLGERLGAFTDQVEVLEEGGLPSLYAELPGWGDRRLLLYGHYDVQPVDPLDLWESPPFEPTEVAGHLVARGVCDDKADVMARLHAIETLKAVGNQLPVTLRFLIEGEEEIGSPSFGRLIKLHGEKLMADGCLWEPAGFDSAGRPQVSFGCRGLLYVHLRVRMLDFDQHSGHASLYPSAAMCLVSALASLRDQDMKVRIDGFYDDVVATSDRDRALLAEIDPELEHKRRLLGFDRLVGDPSPDHAMEQLLFTPTCNVAGLTAGYQGPGSKTVLPAEASAKLDFRLIPDQDPEDILAKLRQHLDFFGFETVEIKWWDGERPSRCDPESEIGKAVIEVEREVLGQPVIWPFTAGTGPRYPIAQELEIPTVGPTGTSRPGSRIHAPNENILISDYLASIKLLCRIWERFGTADRPPAGRRRRANVGHRWIAG